jgi:Mor family transcriptional regulator
MQGFDIEHLRQSLIEQEEQANALKKKLDRCSDKVSKTLEKVMEVIEVAKAEVLDEIVQPAPMLVKPI